MNEKLSAAIDVLLEQLEKQVQQVAGTKRTINALLVASEESPRFEDVEVEKIGGGTIRRAQFYGKPLATAITEFLQIRKHVCNPEGILAGLEEGAFDFKAQGWRDNLRLRGLAISLAKNTKTFHKLPDGSIGLVDWYGPSVIKRSKSAKNATVEPDAAEESQEEGGES